MRDEHWVRALGPPTQARREARARDYEGKAAHLRHKRRLDGASEGAIADETKWYRGRAGADRGRIERVLECGVEELVVTCQCCGKAHELSLRCGSRLYCFSCRTTFAALKRGQFRAARDEVIADASRLNLFFPTRRGGPYGERFITLTAPHLGADSISSRIERVLDAWPQFLKKLNRFFKERAIGHAEWFRVIEWTEGDDKLGHPHFHVWLFSPWIDEREIRRMWHEALVLAGGPADVVPVVHVVKVLGRDGGSRELIKYLTKDITAGGEKLRPDVYAQVINTLEGKRTTQASKGFMGRAKKAPATCEDCGSTLPKDVRKKKRAEGPEA